MSRPCCFHKINNVLGQCLLAKRMGKTRVIAETGAGQHGVATATAAALMGLECEIFMGKEDNAAAQDFLSRLPLEVPLNDYNNITEKIFYPSPALTTTGVTRGCAPVPGDITIYVPWNNVAIFCKSGSQSNDLIKIGRIDGDGIDALNVPGNVAVKFERQS